MSARDESSRGARGAAWRGALAGIASAALLFGTAQLLSIFFGPASTPFAAVGSTFIDFTPAWLKDFAIAAFGTNDKTALLVAMAVVAAAASAALGVLALKRPRTANVLVLAAAVAMAACILTRSGAGPLDILPLAVGTAAALWALRMLTEQAVEAARPGPAARADQAQQPGNPSRRAFLAGSAAVAGAAVVLGLAGTLLNRTRTVVNNVRASLRLPAPHTTAPALPEGVQSPVAGVVPFTTPNGDFYRIDTALVPPEVDPGTWELRVHGMVEQEFTMGFDELLAQELTEAQVTLACVSNEVGGNLVGNATWLGLPLREVLARARPLPGADMVLSTSVDGFTASTPLPVLQDGRNALLAVGMNGEPLPVEHGFPVRMVVPGLYGYVSATKWVVELEVTTFAQQTAYWTSRGWSSHGPVKTASRIEVPRGGAQVPAGKVALGGSAWAQHRGISKVEVQLDGGPWLGAQLAAEASLDTWRQWSFIWDGATAGSHTARVRAYDSAGALQVSADAPPAPDGATGWHSVGFTVA
ncbi:DMSO/TMAO reductase YedYZ molybdopterin-dependent catalytic subunit [Arthrobacter stackebrandtii]|uniref:DMSO/TMAO reductase YedYZ molybdopterin-dependent catalytic subunit n=1 Tax=Arthrobacter stackebrandtii TaxID=272161 RepID=A0ABS4YXL4_9MICC|nr:molybdopterin-dependent oxidoreductase [Arthrobacter stackebrandtii]MBP2413544.1 DMSO/TMAO reductase YedYZ molybdopterin-dependent catalytic subunit [Arthrobacter stackebrandtii]PYH00623.1 oxidoreductase [Arthrobacter stackebrandtii]